MSQCQPKRDLVRLLPGAVRALVAVLCLVVAPGYALACGTARQAIDLIQLQQAIFAPGVVPSTGQLDRFIDTATAFPLSDVSDQVNDIVRDRDISGVRASLADLQDLALIGARFGADAAANFAAQPSLRNRAERTERVLSVACGDIAGELGGSAEGEPGAAGGAVGGTGNLRRLSPLTQLTGMSMNFDTGGNLAGFGYLMGLIVALCSLLFGVRALFFLAHSHIYNRCSCLVRAMVEVDGVAVDGRIKVLGKRGFRFVADAGDFSGRIFDLIDADARGYATIGRKRLAVSVTGRGQDRCSADFDRPLSLSQLRECLAMSRVSTHPVVNMRRRRRPSGAARWFRLIVRWVRAQVARVPGRGLREEPERPLQK
ncbi:MAG: hypothetical protein AAF367_03510 [Pseudomonadota bacterium]